MVAITDNTKSKSERVSLKEEPINGGIKRWETLMSSIFMKSTCSSKKSMFLCREAHKSSFDVNQESCVVKACRSDVRHVTGTAAWLSSAHTTKGKTAIIQTWPCLLAHKELKACMIRRLQSSMFTHQSHRWIYMHVRENQRVIRQPGEHGRGGFSTSSFSPTAKIAPLQPLQSHNSVKNNCLICNRLMHLMVKVF